MVTKYCVKTCLSVTSTVQVVSRWECALFVAVAVLVWLVGWWESRGGLSNGGRGRARIPDGGCFILFTFSFCGCG